MSQKGIRLAIALPLEEESRGLEGIDAVDTIVSRRTDPRTIHMVRYVGSNLAYEWWTRDGKLHGMFVMHPHKVVAGPGGTTPGARYCYQNGEKAALGECGATAAAGNSVSGAAAILGGLAVVALSNDAGFSEDSAIDLGVSVARDIERGELTRDTYESVQNAKPESTKRQAATSATRSSNGSAPGDSSNGKLSENSVEYLRYTSAGGAQRELPVNKSARANYAGFYANEHRDPAVADYRYQLNPDGSATLEHKACESCTHELSGDSMSRSWTEEYQAIEWAPMLNDQGKPLTRQVKDMNGETHRARVLVVLLQGGRTMSLSHYNAGGREALAGPYGVPRLKTN